MLTLQIKNSGTALAEISHDSHAQLVYTKAYREGDSLCVHTSDTPCHLMLRLEDSMPECLVYLKGNSFELAVPFGEQASSYCPKSFTGNSHYLSARLATAHEVSSCRDLAMNAYDCHSNTTLFPHATANVETRGEAVFAARNAIDGSNANSGHGIWPYQSWGIQRREDARFEVDFGREVKANGIAITIRCDFPHDNYWHHATVEFSDGSREVLKLAKVSEPQFFPIAPRTCTKAALCEMKKDETDESPFPALTAFCIFGSDI